MADFKEQVELNLTGNFSKESSKAAVATSQLSNALKILGGAAVVGAVTNGVKKSVEAFLEQEKATKRQESALRALGITSKAATQDIVSFAGSLQRTTGIADELILDTTRLFTQFGLVGREMKDATKLAIDLSAAFGKDLTTTTLMVAKASQGHFDGLSKLGVKFDESTKKSGDFTRVLSELNKQFGGSAQAAMQGYAGQVQAINTQMSEVSEKVGELAVKLLHKSGVLRSLNDTLGRANAFWDDHNNEMTQAGNAYDEQAKKVQRLKNIMDQYAMQPMAPIMDVAKNKKDFEAANLELSRMKENIEKIGKANQKASQEAESQTKAAKKNSPIMSADELKKASDEYQDFYRTLVKETSSGLVQISALRDADQGRLDEWLRKGIISKEKYAEASKKIVERTVTFQFETAQKGLDSVGDLFKGNVDGFLDTFQSLFPPVVGAAMGLARSAVSAIGSIFSAFGSDTRTEFAKIVSNIQLVRSEFQKAMDEMNTLRDERAKLAGKQASDDFGGLFSEAELKKIAGGKEFRGGGVAGTGVTGAQLKQLLKGMRAEISEDGTIAISAKKGGKIYGLIGPDGEVIVREHIPGLSDRAAKEFFKNIAPRLLSSGTLQPYEKESATLAAEPSTVTSSSSGGPVRRTFGFAMGGMVPFAGAYGDRVPAMLEGGEYVVSRRNVNNRTLGMLRNINHGGGGSGGSQNFVFNISAMDAMGVKEFLERRVQPMMRDLSRNTNSIFLSPKGTSGRA